MAPLHRVSRTRILGGLVTIGAISWIVSRIRRRRPAAAELMSLGDEEFQAFVRRRGLRTASDLGIEVHAS